MKVAVNKIRRNALAYSATTLASSMMNTTFNYYYVKVFLQHFKISETWFYLAHASYMIWNAVNDPVFGWLQDSSKLSCIRRRHLAILYGAPIFVLRYSSVESSLYVLHSVSSLIHCLSQFCNYKYDLMFLLSVFYFPGFHGEKRIHLSGLLVSIS
jgi:hypothetical protein